MINSRIVHARACAEKAPLVLRMSFCRWRQLSHDTLFQRVYRKKIGSKGGNSSATGKTEDQTHINA